MLWIIEYDYNGVLRKVTMEHEEEAMVFMDTLDYHELFFMVTVVVL